MAACEKAFKLLESGRSALDASVEATCILEDDGRFNAGSGSIIRLDGRTVEMDAAVMDSQGNIGSVISIRNVKNPIAVARAVIDTPHVALSGQGATAYAVRRGFAPLKCVSPSALDRYERLRHLIQEGKTGDVNPRLRGYDIKALWNFEGVSYSDVFSHDKVGVAVLDPDGHFAVATSMGGASPMMLGRVGDTPIDRVRFLRRSCRCGSMHRSGRRDCPEDAGEESI